MAMTAGLTDAQSAAVGAVLNLASPELRSSISAMINAALGPSFGKPYADSAVLSAVGQALVRYSGA
jgi:hypothetical protein